MEKYFTTKEQAVQLLKAGIDPHSCNLVDDLGVIRRADRLSGYEFVSESRGIGASFDDFPQKSLDRQIEFMDDFGVFPVWTADALVETIPKDPRQMIILSRVPLLGQYRAIYRYENKSRNIYIEKLFCGKSMLESAVMLATAYLSDIRPQIN